MSVIEEIHVGDVGTVFEVTVKDGDDVVDISSMTTKDFFFKDPDGNVETVNGAFKTDGTDGIMTYTVTSSDDILDAAGIWYMQIHVSDGTNSWKSNVVEFTVYENLA